MKIYTRTGDKGETGLFGGPRVRKNHPRVDAYGEVDELNTVLGLARAELEAGEGLPGLDAALARVQDELFMVGALLATPRAAKLAPPFDRGLPAEAATRLEREIDAWDAELKPLAVFILPGGGRLGAQLHLARAVSRRAERASVALGAVEPPLPDNVIVYLNRLSDWLFTAARWVNKKQGRAETPWNGLK
ncbi:MAG: cob(I)yrinic acid a,c-diamide adenosyltransferase [Elusimicrobiota bacterium]|nr:cob(I)yrinic acid a,c-diamide adenosyltransferase [Elusimicrobiota bacterium]